GSAYAMLRSSITGGLVGLGSMCECSGKNTGVGAPGPAARLGSHFSSAAGASRELIDDEGPSGYDLLRIVRKSYSYECVQFTQSYFVGHDPAVPAVADGGGHGFGHIAQ